MARLRLSAEVSSNLFRETSFDALSYGSKHGNGITKMTMKKDSLILAVGLLSPSLAFSTAFVATPADLNANDTLTWAQLGANGTSISNPFAATTTASRSVTVSQATGHGYASSAGAGYGPMYAPGERLYLTDDGFGFNGGPLTFVFEKDVNGFGVVCDPDYYVSGFAGTISAYDASDVSLGSFPFSVSAAAPYKQVFAGISNTVANIHRVVIDGTFAEASPEDFAVGTALVSVDEIFADGFD